MNNHRESPLCIAIANENYDKVDELLNNGTDPNIPGTGIHPISKACLLGNNKFVIKLLKHGADPNKISSGHTPLYRAVKNNHYDIVKTLLDNGADPNVISSNKTCIYKAVENNNQNIITILLNANADPNIINQFNKQYYLYSLPLGVAIYNKNCSIIKQLVDTGASTDTLYNQPYESILRSPYYIASFYKDDNVMKTLQQLC
jgi:ankyrin repeat protein